MEVGLYEWRDVCMNEHTWVESVCMPQLCLNSYCLVNNRPKKKQTKMYDYYSVHTWIDMIMIQYGHTTVDDDHHHDVEG